MVLTLMAVISASHLGFTYGQQPVLEDVSFAVEAGEFAALVGPNGSGKSTLLRHVADAPAVAEAPGILSEERHGAGRRFQDAEQQPQRLRLQPDLPATVEEVVRTGRLPLRGWWRRPRRADQDAVDHALESVALADLRHRRIGELSGGQQQRALIAKAFAGEPEVLVLDEPIAGVDAESQRLFRDSLVHLVAEHNATVLLVSHELGAVADDLDRVVVLKRTVVFDGAPGDLAATGVHLGVHDDDLPRWLEDLS